MGKAAHPQTKEALFLYFTGFSATQVSKELNMSARAIAAAAERYHQKRLTGRAGMSAEYSRKYEKTPKGYLMRCYRNMKSRVTGVQKKKAHLYKGKTLLPKEDFYAWAQRHPDFLYLFNAYLLHDFNQKLAPTVDRIDSTRGYTLDNMRWLTHSQNSVLGCTSPARHSDMKKAVYKAVGVKHE